MPSIISTEWCVAFSKKLPLWKGCTIFRSGFLIHFCQFVSSVNKKDPLPLTMHAQTAQLLSVFSQYQICWVYLCHAVASRQCLTRSAKPGGSISAERRAGALRRCFVGCGTLNERSWRLWLQRNALLLPWGLCDAAAHWQGPLPSAAAAYSGFRKWGDV